MSRWPLILLVPFLLMSACAESDDDPSATPDPTVNTPPPAETSETPDVPDPTLTAKPTGTTQLLTGVVSAGVEDNCLILTTTASGQSGSWVLVGEVAGLADGDRVTLRGSPAPSLSTRCQQGTPFVVEAVEPG
ncbi:MAG: hypothetical protein ABW075_01715 [Aeromicrobium sp.]